MAKTSQKNKPKKEDKKEPTSPERDKYLNPYGRFKAGNPGRPKGAKGKRTGFRKALLEVFDRTGGVESLLNYLTHHVEIGKDGKAKIKYERGTGDEGLAEILNTPRYEFLLSMLVKTTPKTELEDDGEDGSSYEARMKKVDQQLKSNPDLKEKLLDELEDES